MVDDIPTLYDWAGGMDAFVRLCDAFYARVRVDDLLAPVFAPRTTAGIRAWSASTWGWRSPRRSDAGG